MSSGNMQTEAQNETEAAQQAAQEAVSQARETAGHAVATIRAMDSARLAYLGCLTGVVAMTLIFDMASFTIATPDHAVSETVADAQRSLQAQMNSWAYSAFSSTVWGKLAWFSAVGGVGLMVWAAVKKSPHAWGPLAQVGLAALCTLCLMLLFFVGFPDLSAYSGASCSATLFGYWVPLLAAGAATFLSAKPFIGSPQ